MAFTFFLKVFAMKVLITVEIPDEPFQGLMAALWSTFSGSNRVVSAPAEPGAELAPEPAKKSTRSKKADPPPETTPDPSEPTSEVPEAAEVAPTVEDVLERAAAFMKEVKDGAAKVSKILTEMKVKKVREIPVERLAEFLAKLAAE
jgi:hypothetical protein